MGWIVCGLFLFFVFRRLAGGAGKDSDDFAGNSLESYFMLEVFIDDRKSQSEAEELDQGEQFLDYEEDDWFEEEL